MKQPQTLACSRNLDAAALALRLPLLLALAACSACSSGGGGGGNPGLCSGSAVTQLGGPWHVTGSLIDLDPEVGDTYVQNGLHDAQLALQFAAVEPEPGPNGNSVCSAAYLVTSPDLDTHSHTGAPTTILAGAVSPLPDVPEGVFVLADAVYYYPAGDVSVRIGSPESLQKISDTVFECSASFNVYEGQQIVALVTDEPGVDDDEDGQIDEPDEGLPSDEIDPAAPRICSGHMRFTFTRGSSLAANESAAPGLGFHGAFVAEDGLAAHSAWATLLPERASIGFEIQDVLVPGGKLRIRAAMQPDGSFGARAPAGEALIELVGRAESDLVPSGELTITAASRKRTLHFVADVERGAATLPR